MSAATKVDTHEGIDIYFEAGASEFLATANHNKIRSKNIKDVRKKISEAMNPDFKPMDVWEDGGYNSPKRFTKRQATSLAAGRPGWINVKTQSGGIERIHKHQLFLHNPWNMVRIERIHILRSQIEAMQKKVEAIEEEMETVEAFLESRRIK